MVIKSVPVRRLKFVGAVMGAVAGGAMMAGAMTTTTSGGPTTTPEPTTTPLPEHGELRGLWLE